MYGLFKRYRRNYEEPTIIDVIKYDDGSKDPGSDFPRSDNEHVASFVNPSGDITSTFKKAEEWVRSLHGVGADIQDASKS